MIFPSKMSALLLTRRKITARVYEMTEQIDFRPAPFIGCCDLLHLGDALAEMKRQHPAELMFPVGDGEFAPLSSGLDIVRQISLDKQIQCHVLLLTAHPERHIEACAAAGCAALTISLEASRHHHRILAAIRASGMKSGLALNPATSLLSIDYLLEGMDEICLLGVEPGHGRDTVDGPALVERVKMMRESIRYRELRTEIRVCGGISIELAGRAIAAGASIVGIEPLMMAESGAACIADAMQKCASLWKIK